MQTRHALFVPFILIIVLALASCTTGPKRTDAQIASDVQSKIGSDLRLANKQISVQAKDGVVMLTGRVDNDTEKKMVETYASGTEGVKSVMNNIEVVTAAQLPPPAVEPPPAPAGRKATKAAKPAPAAERPASQAAAAAAPRAGAPPAAEERVAVPAGTDISVRMIDGIDSEKNKPGDKFRATVEMPVVIDGRTVIPKGADVQGTVINSASAGHFQGRSQLALVLHTISYAGKSYDLKTEEFTRAGSSRGKKTAAMVGGGGAVGAIIGGIAGGGKGAAIGAASGAGAGAGVQAVTKAQQVRVPSETIVDFKLKTPVTVTPAATAGRR